MAKLNKQGYIELSDDDKKELGGTNIFQNRNKLIDALCKEEEFNNADDLIDKEQDGVLVI